MIQLPEHLRDLQLVGLDFETYYEDSTGYSLKNKALSTSTYVRNPQFEALSVAVRTSKDRKAKAYAGKDVEPALRDIDWGRSILLCHHGHFDGLILTHHYGLTPAYYMCTLSMGRALHGNSIDNDLDSVAQYWGVGNKLPNILGECEGKHLEDMSPALVRKLLRYNAQDVDVMWRVLERMLQKGFPAEELDLIDLTLSLFTEPVLEIDRELAEKERVKERDRRIKLFNTLAARVGIKKEIEETIASYEERIRSGKKPRKTDLFTVPEHVAKRLSSGDQFAAMLRTAGVVPPLKQSPTHPDQQIYAFARNDLKFQTLQAHENPEVRMLAEARLQAKSNIAEERAIKLLERSENGMRMPIYLNAYGAHTMRWSGGDRVNAQNFPVEGRKGNDSKIRRCLRAPHGMQIVVVDSSQIEGRTNAWFAKEWDLLESFADPKRDPYCEFASDLYGRKITKKNEAERFVGKACVLGLGFGMGPHKLQLMLATGAMGPPVFLSLEMCEKAVQLFRRTNALIQAMWRQLNAFILAALIKGQQIIVRDLICMEKEQALMPNGLSLHYPGIQLRKGEYDEGTNYYYRGRHGKWSKIYGGLLDENCVQCLARIIVGEQALKIAERYRILTLSHDEVVYLAPTSRAKRALDYGLECLSTPPHWGLDIPLAAEGGYAKEYSK